MAQSGLFPFMNQNQGVGANPFNANGSGFNIGNFLSNNNQFKSTQNASNQMSLGTTSIGSAGNSSDPFAGLFGTNFFNASGNKPAVAFDSAPQDSFPGGESIQPKVPTPGKVPGAGNQQPTTKAPGVTFPGVPEETQEVINEFEVQPWIRDNVEREVEVLPGGSLRHDGTVYGTIDDLVDSLAEVNPVNGRYSLWNMSGTRQTLIFRMGQIFPDSLTLGGGTLDNSGTGIVGGGGEKPSTGGVDPGEGIDLHEDVLAALNASTGAAGFLNEFTRGSREGIAGLRGRSEQAAKEVLAEGLGGPGGFNTVGATNEGLLRDLDSLLSGDLSPRLNRRVALDRESLRRDTSDFLNDLESSTARFGAGAVSSAGREAARSLTDFEIADSRIESDLVDQELDRILGVLPTIEGFAGERAGFVDDVTSDFLDRQQTLAELLSDIDRTNALAGLEFGGKFIKDQPRSAELQAQLEDLIRLEGEIKEDLFDDLGDDNLLGEALGGLFDIGGGLLGGLF